MTRVRGVEVVHWNPRRSLAPGVLPRTTRVNNFGDLLGPMIVERLCAPDAVPRAHAPRLVSVGSILHLARDGEVVWGTGVNGKLDEGDRVRVRQLDVRAVRGPLTADVLRRRGMTVPDVFGDPGLLAPSLLGIERARPTIPITSVPNLNERASWRGKPGLVDPRTGYRGVIETIARSGRVVASSLHAIVIADVLGVPVSPVLPSHESIFKYEDYYEGTGRRVPRFATSYEEALDDIAPPLSWTPDALRAAFPSDLWQPTA
ncbi:polysaccharide pyruvyl transferase family protein [Microbacterium sp. NPDC055683]